MTIDVEFRTYARRYREACLVILDVNTPVYFAPNERLDYSQFFDANPTQYEVCMHRQVSVMRAFGLIGKAAEFMHLNWIMISPEYQGKGVGSTIISRAIGIAHAEKLAHTKIAASHLSAPFFARHCAKSILKTQHGWGRDMHRIDMELSI